MKTLVLTLACFLFCGIAVVQPRDAQAQESRRKAIKSPAANRVPRTTRGRHNPRRRGERRLHRGHNHGHRHGRVRIGRPYVYPYRYQYHWTYRPRYYGHPAIICPQPVPAYPRLFPRPFFYFGW
jgi:hypothetical protein